MLKPAGRLNALLNFNRIRTKKLVRGDNSLGERVTNGIFAKTHMGCNILLQKGLAVSGRLACALILDIGVKRSKHVFLHS
jgi:hypothetical protein